MIASITRNGIMDSLQDMGRYGHQWLGINPGGAMDRLSMQVANILTGNNRHAPVLEMHYPAATIRFHKDVLIALAGAHFTALINDRIIPIHRPVCVQAGSVLSFSKKIAGSRIYLAIAGGWRGCEWLNSHSTHPLLPHTATSTELDVLETVQLSFTATQVLPWQSSLCTALQSTSIRFIRGREWDRLNEDTRLSPDLGFSVDRSANRMGFRLNGSQLLTNNNTELISSAVLRGTIQLLPNGQPLVLMADHQTTGGYPCIGHVISTDVDVLAQLDAGSHFHFNEVHLDTAHDLLLQQERDLTLLQNACNFKLQGIRHGC